MNRIETLTKLVRERYEAKDPNRADWADWLYENHVFVVAEKARAIAEEEGANSELAEVAGMLHDIADASMSRFDPDHEAKSLEIARELLEEVGYEASEIAVVVDDALRFHGCRNGELPQTMEGKVLATADAVAHLTTDFYDFATTALADEGKTATEIQAWLQPKVERDYHRKIAFPSVRAECTEAYNKLSV